MGTSSDRMLMDMGRVPAQGTAPRCNRRAGRAAPHAGSAVAEAREVLDTTRDPSSPISRWTGGPTRTWRPWRRIPAAISSGAMWLSRSMRPICGPWCGRCAWARAGVPAGRADRGGRHGHGRYFGPQRQGARHGRGLRPTRFRCRRGSGADALRGRRSDGVLKAVRRRGGGLPGRRPVCALRRGAPGGLSGCPGDGVHQPAHPADGARRGAPADVIRSPLRASYV